MWQSEMFSNPQKFNIQHVISQMERDNNEKLENVPMTDALSQVRMHITVDYWWHNGM